jgi:hypothetical protein
MFVLQAKNAFSIIDCLVLMVFQLFLYSFVSPSLMAYFCHSPREHNDIPWTHIIETFL